MQAIAGAIVILAGAFLLAFGTSTDGRWAATGVAALLLLFGATTILVDLYYRRPAD